MLDMTTLYRCQYVMWLTSMDYMTKLRLSRRRFYLVMDGIDSAPERRFK